MITKLTYLTQEGRAYLQAKLERLRNIDRLELIECLRDAEIGGDWMDSAEHTLVEEELAFVEAQIRELEATLATSQIIPPDPDPTRINVGDTVVVESADGQVETYTIVGAAETDPAAGLISDESPLGQALLNHQAGDEVLVHAPAGAFRFRVVALENPSPVDS